MPTPTPTGAAAWMSLRILVSALLGGIVFIAIALFFVLGSTDGAYDATPLLLAPLVLGAASHGVSETVGYRLPPTPPGTARDEAQRTSRELFQARLVLRFALSEAVAIVSIAAAFVVTTGGFAVFLVGAVIALALIWWHCWPRERLLARCQQSLERDGGESGLREGYGLPPAGQVITKL